MRRSALVVALTLVLSTICFAESPQYARFRYMGSTATFQSAEKTLSAGGRDVLDMYKTLSGKEWTTDREAKGGVLEMAFLDALAAQGWEVVQLNYRDDETVYLLKKQK